MKLNVESQRVQQLAGTLVHMTVIKGAYLGSNAKQPQDLYVALLDALLMEVLLSVELADFTFDSGCQPQLPARDSHLWLV